MTTLTPSPTTAPVPQQSRRPPARRPRRRGPYPAGRAIAVVLLTLLLAALLDADSLVASVSSERYGTARSLELALIRPFRTVSDALWLNRPHQWLADIAGTNRHNVDASALAASEAESSAISALLRPGLIGVKPRRHLTGSARRNTPPGPQVPTPANPVRVWLAGDSLMGMLADAFLSHVAGDAAVTASMDVQIGTGLARPDVYDWPGQIALELQQQHPQVVVLTFGANDDQDMSAGGQYLVRGTPAWQAEYGRRVGSVMDLVSGAGALLVWVEIPPVQRAQLQQNDAIVNGIVRQQAALHPGVVVVDPTPVVAPGGKFAEYVPGSSGQLVAVRARDGVHLAAAGASRVLTILLAAIRPHWRIP